MAAELVRFSRPERTLRDECAMRLYGVRGIEVVRFARPQRTLPNARGAPCARRATFPRRCRPKQVASHRAARAEEGMAQGSSRQAPKNDATPCQGKGSRPMGVTGLEPVTSCVSSRRSSQLSYTPGQTRVLAQRTGRSTSLSLFRLDISGIPGFALPVRVRIG